MDKHPPLPPSHFLFEACRMQLAFAAVTARNNTCTNLFLQMPQYCSSIVKTDFFRYPERPMPFVGVDHTRFENAGKRFKGGSGRSVHKH